MKEIMFLLALIVILPLQAARNGNVVSGQYPGVVLISAGMQNGSGALIAPDLILTVNHVIEGANLNFSYVFPNYNPQKAGERLQIDKNNIQVLSKDPGSELVLMKLKKESQMRPLKLSREKARPGSLLKTLGYGISPTEGLNRPLQETNVLSNGYWGIANHDVFKEIAINPEIPIMLVLTPSDDNSFPCNGDSGGPVINDNDKVIGVISYLSFPKDVPAISLENDCEVAQKVRVIPIYLHKKWILEQSKKLSDYPVEIE